MNKKYISWRRVSTFKQNRSGLGLEAQKEIIRYFVEREQGEIIADYAECYTGTELSGCTELRKAIAHAKEAGAVLIIAKTDRFRDTIEALQIYEEMGDGNIMFCDLPNTDKFTLTLFFALAEREALIVSIRTTQALAAKKARGCKLGAASENYIRTYQSKTNEQKEIENMERGKTKNLRYLQKRDTQAMLKILSNVFPEHTKDESPEYWDWSSISPKGGLGCAILKMMKDYKEIDNTGNLFRKWDLSGITDAATKKKLFNYIQVLRNSVLLRVKEVA